MPQFQDFKGRARTPTPSEVDLALHIFGYCQEQFGMKPAQLFETNKGLERNGLDALRAGRTTRHFEALVESIYAFLTVTKSAGNNPRLDEIHPWMRDLICTLLPELNPYFKRGPSLFHHRLDEVAVQGDNVRSKIVSCFGGDRYIYRYARNAQDGAARIAKGCMSVPTEIDGMPFHTFSIEYQPMARSSATPPRTNLIEGSILLIKSHFMFFGVENGSDNAFVMVIRDNGPELIYGALILRKHHDRGFMATKGVVMSLAEAGEVVGPHTIDEVPELTTELRELIVNIGNHEGQGPLTLPDV